MRAYADAGGSILFHSTEIPELGASVRPRSCPLRRRIVEEIGAKALTENAILRATLGGGAKKMAA